MVLRDTVSSSGAARLARRSRKPVNGRRPRRIATVIVWISLVYFLVPLVFLLFASTKNNSDLFSSFGLGFGKADSFFSNIRQVLSHDGGIYKRWLFNSLFYAITSAVGAAALATMAGFALSKYSFPGKGAVNRLILGSVLIPLTALAIPTYLVFSRVGLTDTPLAVILPSMVNPFAVFLMREYANEAVDQSLLEAARIDGAGELRIFLTVACPLLAPGIATVLLFTSVATFNNYFLPLIMLTKGSLLPVTVGLAQWQASGGLSGNGAAPLYPLVISGSLIATVPLIAAFIFLQRFWVSGLSTGGVKG